MKHIIFILALIPSLALSLPAQEKHMTPDTIKNREQAGNLLTEYLCEPNSSSGSNEVRIISYSAYITTLSWVNPPPDTIGTFYCCWQISIEVERTVWCRDIVTGLRTKCSQPFLVSRESLFNGRLPGRANDCGQVSEKYLRDFELAFKTLKESMAEVTRTDFDKICK